MSVRTWPARTVLAALVALSALARARAAAADPVDPATRPVEKFVGDETWFVLYVDFERYFAVPAEQAVDVMSLVRPDRSPEQRQAMADRIGDIGPTLSNWGLTQGWMVFGLDDAVRRGGAALVLPLSTDEYVDEVLRFDNVAPAAPVRDERGMRVAAEPTSVWLDDSEAVLVGSRQVVEHYQALDAAPRPDLTDPLNELIAGGATSAAVLSPDRDSRRAVRELWPELPPPFEELTGAMLADDFRWIGAALYLEPAPHGQIIIELRDEQTAERFLAWLGDGLQTLLAGIESQAAVDPEKVADLLPRVAAALQPRREGARIVLDVEPNGDQIRALIALIGPLVNAARAAGMN